MTVEQRLPLLAIRRPIALGLLTLAVVATSCRQAPVSLFAYLAEHDPGPGLIEVTVSKTGEILYRHAEPILTAEDVQEATLTSDAFGRPALELTFTPAGSRRLEEATRDGVGKRLAFVHRGVVLIAPYIRVPLTDGVAFIGGEKLGAEIERLAAELSRL